MHCNRRMFIMAGSGLIVANAAPSDQIRLGVIGSGGRGTFVMRVFQKNPSLRVGAICDVYEPNLERGLSTASKVAGQSSQGLPQLQGTAGRQGLSRRC